MQIQKPVPQCRMAWPRDGAIWWKKTSGGWGPHRLVSVVGQCMEGNLRMGRLMMGK
jgi:hypothetical protein